MPAVGYTRVQLYYSYSYVRVGTSTVPGSQTNSLQHPPSYSCPLYLTNPASSSTFEYILVCVHVRVSSRRVPTSSFDNSTTFRLFDFSYHSPLWSFFFRFFYTRRQVPFEIIFFHFPISSQSLALLFYLQISYFNELHVSTHREAPYFDYGLSQHNHTDNSPVPTYE